MILVTGASGTVGREVVAHLIAAGEKVRAMTRNRSKIVPGFGVTVVEGDLNNRNTLREATNGVNRIFSLALGPEIARQEEALAAVAKASGVRHIVKLSVIGTDSANRSPVAEWHAAGEEAIRQSGVPWTFIRPGAFMSNALFWRETIAQLGKVFSNFGEGKTAYIDPRDIAEVAARALTMPGHVGKAYSLTGPAPLSVAEQVEVLSRVLGQPIEYVRISDDNARGGMRESGMPDYLIDALLPFASAVREGKAAQVLPTVEELLGRPARTFEDWALAHAPLFTPNNKRHTS